MRRRIVARLGAGAIVVAIAGSATARAPVDQYGTFDPSDTTIIDTQTGLRWQRGFASATSWDDANAYCAALALGGYGVGAWRLPSVKELLTLVDEAIETEYVGRALHYYAIDRNAFPGTPDAAFYAWPKVASQAWKVDFSNGVSGLQAAGNPAFVRCVH